MMERKDAFAFFVQFVGLAKKVLTVNIADADEAYTDVALAEKAKLAGLDAIAMDSVTTALVGVRDMANGPVRILICGSLVLAGQVLASNEEFVWKDPVEA